MVVDSSEALSEDVDDETRNDGGLVYKSNGGIRSVAIRNAVDILRSEYSAVAS